MLPGQSATTMQVAGSITAAVAWMINHPSEGVCVPADLPWQEVLNVARRYLGTMHSGPADWDPVSSRRDLFAHFSDEANHVDATDPWQFTNFLTSG